MKILYVITGLGLGGAEKVVCDLADKMNDLGHYIKIVYLTGEALVKPNNDIDIEALYLNNIADLPKAVIRYRKIVKDFRPDIIHAHMVHANIFARLNRFGSAVPKLICTAHSSNEGGRVRMIAYRLSNKLSNLNTNVSQEATKALIDKKAFNRNDLITVYNGVDLDKFKKNAFSENKLLSNRLVSIITVGRFNDAKDYPNLIKAFAILKKNINQKIKLTIVGDGELRSEIEQLIQSLELTQDIELLGRRSDIPELLNQADIFVLASKYEGLPTVIIEAMACECYVVATDCGGTAEILGDTGKLVPIENSQALADALAYAVQLNDDERLKNNQKARLRVEKNFSLDAAVKKWLSYYES